MATTLVPGTHTGWNIEKWQRTVEAATYQKMVMIPIIDEGDRPFGELNIRKHARVSSSGLAQTDTGTGLTYSVIIGTPVAVTPAGNYVAAAWSENEDAQVDLNLDSEARGNLEGALAESSDQSVLANVATLTQNMSQADVDAPMFRKAFGRLAGNTNGMAMPGGKATVHAIFSHTQYPNLGNIPEFNNAEVRGGSETPYVTGIWMKGGGVMLHMSTVVDDDANGWHNVMFLPSAFVVAWNKKTLVRTQIDELEHRVILYNNFGSAIKHDLRAIDLRTTASGL